MRIVFAFSSVLLLTSCNAAPPARPPAATATPAPKPTDESRRFPKANLVGGRVVDRQLMNKSFMPGGTLAHYKKGKAEFDIFVARAASANAAAITLLDWQKALTGAKFVAAFGGYFGTDNNKPTFVFTKGEWIAGISGLPEREADQQARYLAARL